MEPLLQAVDQALPGDLFVRLNRAFLRVGPERFAQTHWTTFWYPLSQPPRNALELAIRALQTRFALRARGVEWWLGRMDTRDVPIDLHADRDNHLFDQSGELRHPRLSSVLYMNRVRGGCLLVSERRGQLEAHLGDASALRGRWEVARPQPNRFVWFDGDCVHGVLDARNRVPSGRLRLPAGRLRRSLVLNWWARRPRGIPEWDGSTYRPLFK